MNSQIGRFIALHDEVFKRAFRAGVLCWSNGSN